MKITKEFLELKHACQSGLEYVTNNGFLDLEDKEFIVKLMEHKQYQWANWLIVRVMEYKQYVSFAVFAAEQVIDIFEKKYPDNKRPRQAIEAAKRCIIDDSEENKKAAYAAYAAAADAAYAAYAADAYAAYAAAADAAYAAYAAAYAAAREEMQIRILNYGLTLLTNEK